MRESERNKKRTKKMVVSGLIGIVVVSLVLGLAMQPASAAFTKKAPIPINNTAGTALSYYQVNLNVTYDSDMNNDFSDIRVKNETSGTFVPYWIEDKVNGSYANIWFNATFIPASSWCNDTYYLYYGDAGASSERNGTETFEFFDDFSDGTYEGKEDGIVSSFGGWTGNRASYIVGNYAYVVVDTDLHIVDISNVSAPILKGSVVIGGQCIDVIGNSSYAYVSSFDTDKLSIVNVSNVDNPSIVGNVTDSIMLDGIHGLYKAGNYVYCCAYTDGSGGNFTIVDVSTPSSPVIRGSIANDANNYIKGSHDVKVIGNYAYMTGSNHHATAGDDGRFTILNVSDKDNISVVSSITSSSLHRIADIQISGNYAFVGQFGHPQTQPEHRYFRTIDISDVNNPFVAGGLAGYNMYAGYIHGDLIYCADNRYDTVTVINISTPTEPTFVKQYNIPGQHSVLHVALTEDGSHAVVARHGTNQDFYIINATAVLDVDWFVYRSEIGDTASASTKKLVVEKGDVDGNFILTHHTATQYSSKHFWEFLFEYQNQSNLLLSGNNIGPNVYQVGAGAIYLMFRSSTNELVYYDTAYHVICSVDKGTEYKVSIVPDVSTDTFSVYVYNNGTEVSYSGAHTGLNFRYPVTYLNRWQTSQCPVIDRGIYDNFKVRNYASPEPSASLGTEQVIGSAGAYNITLHSGWNIIGWTDTTTRTAHTVGGLIGSNCTQLVERNRTTGNYNSFDPAVPELNNFNLERGWGYYVYVSAETVWSRTA